MTQCWVSKEGDVNWGRVQRGGEHDQNVLYNFLYWSPPVAKRRFFDEQRGLQLPVGVRINIENEELCWYSKVVVVDSSVRSRILLAPGSWPQLYTKYCRLLRDNETRSWGSSSPGKNTLVGYQIPCKHKHTSNIHNVTLYVLSTLNFIYIYQ